MAEAWEWAGLHRDRFKHALAGEVTFDAEVDPHVPEGQVSIGRRTALVDLHTLLRDYLNVRSNSPTRVRVRLEIILEPLG